MSNLLSQELFDQLSRLARFMLLFWRRRPLHEAIVKQLNEASSEYEKLMHIYLDTKQQLQQLRDEHVQLTKSLALTSVELSGIKGELHQLTDEHVKQIQSLAQTHIELKNKLVINERLQQELNGALLTIKQQADDYNDVIYAHNGTKKQLLQLGEDYVQLTQSLDLTRTELNDKVTISERLQQELIDAIAKNDQLTNAHDKLALNHQDMQIRYQLISQLLAAKKPINEGVLRFNQLLFKDYMAFAEVESSLAAEAKALSMLQSVAQEIELLVSFKDIFQRTIVGIVGGFSSGKSEFVNSFIQDREVRLTVGVQPVTAIPSYVLATEQRVIRGYSASGGYINLDVGFYKQISHAFINSFSFDLKSLMPFMCVGARMDPAFFNNICFIDTPGYNPPSTAGAYSHNDKQTAIQFARQSDVMIWVIGLDANGTIPDSDLEFIHEVGFDSRPVYIVLNKADLRSEEDLENIMDDVESVLDFEDIPYVGICAYSSVQCNEIIFRRCGLMDYFKQINRQTDALEHISQKVMEVFDMYDAAIQADIDVVKQQKILINGLKLDALEIGGEELYEKMSTSIWKLESNFDASKFEGWLRESKRLRQDFIKAIEMVM